MHRLESINGQQTVIDAVAALWDKPSAKEFFVVAGPVGAGVSWTLQRCSQIWERRGGAALEAKADGYALDRRLFPWLTMAAPGAKRVAREEVLKQGIAQGSRLIPVVGSFTSYIVEEVLNHRKKNLKRQALLLNDQEQDLLYVIQTKADSKPLLLSLDQVEAWDEASWSLLSLIVSDRLHDLYPALRNAILLIGTSREMPERLRLLLSELRPKEFELTLLDVDQMPLALSTFGFPSLSTDQLKLLFQITNGRLDLLHDLSRHLHEYDLASGNWSELYSGLIQRRIQGLREQINDLEDTLSAAAIIGRSFTVSDVSCLVGCDRERIATALRLACAEHFLSTVGDTARFESAELHGYFHRIRSSDHGRYHAKFAECLRIMRPGEYEARTYHLLQAGEIEAAQTSYALAALAARRNFRPPPDPRGLESSSGWPDVRVFLEAMNRGFDAYDEHRISDGLAVVESIETFLPEVLIAEKDYLEALLLLALPSVATYDRARIVLERWSSLATSEPEVWARLAQNLIVAQAQCGHLDEAKQLEARLTADYYSRRQTDPWALYNLNVLRRRAECVHSLPTATQRLESALAYFGCSNAEEIPRHPIQYYYTVTNLIANLIASGRFDEACRRASELDELIRRHPSISWPSPEIAANNAVVARFLSGLLETQGAADLFTKVTEGSTESGDRLLLQNNSAVLAIRSGRITEGRRILEAALEAVANGSEPDGYHRYFLTNNLAGLLALDGDVPAALQLIDTCATLLDQFYPAIRVTMARRQQLIPEAINEAPRLTASEFDAFLIERYGMQIGPQWAFYGRGFLLTDIQFWSAD